MRPSIAVEDSVSSFLSLSLALPFLAAASIPLTMSISTATPLVLEFGMGVDVHGQDCTKAARRAVSDAIRHSSLPLLAEIRGKGGTMLVEVTVAVPDPASVDVDAVKAELPHGEVTVRAVEGGLRVPNSDALIACAAITVSARY
jgi:uncharacterized protein (TIGR02058 family)